MNPQMTEALALLKSAASREPKNLETQRKVFVTLANTDSPQEAVPFFLAIVRIQPEWTQYHLEAFHACSGTGAIDRLRQAFQQAIDESSETFLLWYGLGLAANSVGDLEAAITAYSSGLKANPDYAPLHYNLGVAEKSAGKEDQANERHKTAIAISPEFAEPHFALGVSLMNSDTNESIKHLEKYVTLNRPHLSRFVPNAKKLLAILKGEVPKGSTVFFRL